MKRRKALPQASSKLTSPGFQGGQQPCMPCSLGLQDGPKGAPIVRNGVTWDPSEMAEKYMGISKNRGKTPKMDGL